MIRITLLLFYALLTGCVVPPTVPPAKPPEPSKKSVPDYIRKVDSSQRVFVFIHGIFGDALDTWKNQKNGKYFWDYLDDEPQFNNSDIYVYGYPSYLLNEGYNIDEAVNDLHNRLDIDDVFKKHRQVIFVVHSMGGLITERYLTKFRDNASKVPFIVSYSTPNQGSDIAKIAKYVARNPALIELVPYGMADTIVSDWRAAKSNTAAFPTLILCAYETKKTFGVQIVDKYSATLLCNDPSPQPVFADHIEIVKPEEQRSPALNPMRAAVRSLPEISPAIPSSP